MEISVKKGKKVELWLQDEMRIGQRGTVARVWSKKNVRIRREKQQGFEYMYLYGAVSPATGNAVGLVMPSSNMYCMEIFLKELSKKISKDKHCVLIVDRASWHTSKKLLVPGNITLIKLPPYSPELNSIEQVWAWLRRHYFSNKVFKNLQHLVDEICKGWNNFCSRTNLVKSISRREYYEVLS